jgi:RNA 3'-phosphate cyclase
VAGDELNSRELTFRPHLIQAGHYLFDVAEKTGSAGSVTLIAQALIPPLLRAAGPSTLILRGGTHVPWSPPAHYLLKVFLPALARMGGEVKMSLESWGWYPRGGGELRLQIIPSHALKGVEWRTPAPPAAFRALSAASRLPEHIIRRQAERLKVRLGETLPVDTLTAPGPAPGTLVFIWGPQAGFSGLGARGKPAEKVADEAADAYLAFKQTQAGVDRHLTDQMVLYLAQAGGPSHLVTEEITSHLLTNLWVIQQFLGPIFQVRGKLGEPGEILCQGRG